MSSTSLTFEQKVAALATADFQSALPQIQHGVEREALRIKPNGLLSQDKHPKALGSALTHDSITTDFSESLLEFITPPETSVQTTLDQLSDIHKFVMGNIADEALWPMSMPCYVSGESNIPIADYGDSNIGRMKTTYRIGLKNRYGAMMQAISGVHFNFSLPQSYWTAYAQLTGGKADQDARSQHYFDMIRNYRRWCWLIPFLYGSSPAICSSFIGNKQHNLPFQKMGKGSLYLPYATSLRMSDLGYTNSQQSVLHICYNRLPEYISSVRQAIRTHSSEYERFSAGENGLYEQLNRNILQIENELYSPIRPKQPTESMEKPSDALASRGVSYIEVRALDVNPFSDIGISENQFYFLDVFLLTCLLWDSPEFDPKTYKETETNLKRAVINGRDPELTLLKRDFKGLGNPVEEVKLQDWARLLFERFAPVAAQLDSANQTTRYSQAVRQELAKVNDFSLTPSAQLLDHLLSNNLDNGAYGVSLSQQYKQGFIERDYRHFDESYFVQQTAVSLDKQHAIEAANSVNFDDFLRDYFAKA
ncbi:glutamate--cysteine ligase [Alteromonas oceanisediminis]|uniref:glutamate--cysteine ligase n=1 Tax=Alteromonas oceanisediminis TaxID=2836180 RepID=UPI001BD9C3E4|nr:glutamate--cysteine ligase [Alteromonas oceanisediminis]